MKNKKPTFKSFVIYVNNYGFLADANGFDLNIEYAKTFDSKEEAEWFRKNNRIGGSNWIILEWI